MKVIKGKAVLRMRSKFRITLLCSKLTFLKVDLKSIICHLNEELKTTEQEKTHQNKPKAENTLCTILQEVLYRWPHIFLQKKQYIEA